MKYRAILFDFDGTLSPSLPLWVQAFHIALRSYGIALSDQEVIQRFFFRDWNEAADTLQVGSVEKFRGEINRGLREAFQQATLFPLVLALLERCREHGLQTALVTSAPRLVLDDVMPRLGLERLFDFVVCADDVQNFKPHPEPVLMTLSALNCAPQAALMVGDSTADVYSGKAAGTTTALFMPDDHRPYYRFDALHASEPDHIFVDHAELPGIIGLRAEQ